jgi:hypothetical protein
MKAIAKSTVLRQLVPYRTLARRNCCSLFLERLCSHAWTRARSCGLFDQFKHGAFALTQLFGHRKQFWLV